MSTSIIRVKCSLTDYLQTITMREGIMLSFVPTKRWNQETDWDVQIDGTLVFTDLDMENNAAVVQLESFLSSHLCKKLLYAYNGERHFFKTRLPGGDLAEAEVVSFDGDATVDAYINRRIALGMFTAQMLA